MNMLTDWYRNVASNRPLTLLLIVFVAITLFVTLTARMLAPFFAAVVFAYLLQIAMDGLQRKGLSKSAALALSYGLFLLILVALIAVIPLLARQTSQVVRAMPQFIAQAQDILEHLPENYPNLITAEQVDELIERARGEFLAVGENLVGYVGGTLVGIFTAIVYLVIVPLMVFFMLKDRDAIVAYLGSFLPQHTELADQAWAEIHQQLRNYVGGKAIQMLIVAAVCYVTFEIIDLNFAALLAVTIALSVLIPYVGPALATLPVAIVSVLEWGFNIDAVVPIAAYAVIHFLDGNILVPLLFSEAVAIHPVAIIVSILFFGGIWGVWGVFFAIPLAVVVKAVINALPGRSRA